jgi:phage shock protein C
MKTEKEAIMTPKKQAEPSIRRLYKSRRDRVISGVCGGIAEYFHVDVVIVRIAWVLSVFLHGIGLLAYLLAVFVVPSDPEVQEQYSAPPAKTKSSRSAQTASSNQSMHSTKNTAYYLGMFLIALGVLLLLKGWTRDWIDLIRFRWNLDWTWRLFWPLLLVVFGSLYLAGAIRKNSEVKVNRKGRTLFRSRKSKVLTGLCGGIAEYFQIDAAFVRIALVIIALTTSVVFWIVAYAFSAMLIHVQNGEETVVEPE